MATPLDILPASVKISIQILAGFLLLLTISKTPVGDFVLEALSRRTKWTRKTY